MSGEGKGQEDQLVEVLAIVLEWRGFWGKLKRKLRDFWGKTWIFIVFTESTWLMTFLSLKNLGTIFTWRRLLPALRILCLVTASCYRLNSSAVIEDCVWREKVVKKPSKLESNQSPQSGVTQTFSVPL